MVSELQSMVTGQEVTSWLIIAFLVVYFIYKEAPDFKKRITKSAVKEKEDEIIDQTIVKRLDGIEQSIKEINEKLGRDYERINVLESNYKKTEKVVKNSIEESEIIMRALFSIIEGLQELGANGKTNDSATEIHEYLIRKSHDKETAYPSE